MTLLAALDERPVTGLVAPHRAIVTRAFATVATSVPQARRWVRSQLRRRGIGPDDCDRVELLISEAAGNTVRHSHGETFAVRLDLVADRGEASIEGAVYDVDDRLPRLRRPDDDETSGRGIGMIQALAEAWGVRPARPATRPGKWVWFRIRPGDGDGPADGDDARPPGGTEPT